MREEEEERRKGRARAREELSPSLFIPCLTEQSVGRQVWAADESTRSDPRRLAKWYQAGPRTQPDDAISTGVAGKSFGKKKTPEVYRRRMFKICDTAAVSRSMVA